MLAIRKQALQRFGADPKSKRDNNESEVENSAPSGIKDPVEGDGQEEKGEEVQDFWVDLRDLDGTEA